MISSWNWGSKSIRSGWRIIFDILMEKGNPKLAIRYAKRIIKDGEGKTPTEIAPGTKVYELVEELAKYLPEEEKNRFVDSV